MEREEIFQYVKEQYGTEPEYLWKKDPDSAVLRHKNGKWYAIIMAVEKKTLLTVLFMFYSFCIACFAGYTPKEASTASVMTPGSFYKISPSVYFVKMYQGVSLALSYFIIS